MEIPRKMKAAVLFGRDDLRVVEREVPKPGYQEVLVKVEACAICGSDPKLVSKGWPGTKLPYGNFVPGHEYSGTIVALGERVIGFGLGDRIAVEPHKGCGVCENCLRGFYTVCLNFGNAAAGHKLIGFTANGGYAEFAVNPINNLHKVKNLDFEEAALSTTAGSAMYGITRIGGIEMGETVVVAGPGPIGLMAVQIAKQSGAGRVIITGTRAERLNLACELGADISINVTQEDVVQRVFDVTNGIGADAVLECSGMAQSVADAVEFSKKNGRVSVIAVYGESVPINVDKLNQWNIALIGSRAEGDRALSKVLPLMEDGRVKARPLITHTFPLDRVNEAMETFVKRIGGAIKVVLKP
jgi:L-iditol 2-dehydrogenase